MTGQQFMQHDQSDIPPPATAAENGDGELPFPVDALPGEVRTFAESLAVHFSVPVCVPLTMQLRQALPA